MSNINRIEIDIDELIVNIENALSMRLSQKPMFVLAHFSNNRPLGTHNFTIYLNDVYFSCENGKYYVQDANAELLKMRLTHELVHMLSASYGKSGICSGIKYDFLDNDGKLRKYDENTGLNEGITQMFTDEVLDKVTNHFCDGYYDFKKIAQILKYLFGTNVMIDSYFNNSEVLKKGMNKYSNNLYEIINRKLTFANYITSMLHSDVNQAYNADFKVEKDICRSLRNMIFDECLELIIDNLIIPWLREKKQDDIKDEIKNLLEIFNDNTTIKNRVMYFLMKGYKIDNASLPTKSSKTDSIILHLIGVNNNEDYKILDDGNIIDMKSNIVVPYNEQLYEYFYSKIISKNDWELIEKNFCNFHASNNTIHISISGRTIKQRRMLMMALKQYMKKNKYILLNDLDSFDNGDKFEINYINEILTMNDIIYLYKNYTFVCLPGDVLNLLQIVDKKTNRVVTSDSLIGKCRMAYKIASLGLTSAVSEDKWKEFTDIAKNQISKTGMIKKSSLYSSNPFLGLFNDGYGCEWFYDYMRRIPIEFDRMKQELYLSENEMNTSMSKNDEENERLSLLFCSFVSTKTSSIVK